MFENTYTPLPLTDPSMTSLMTGLYPIRHGVRHVSRRFRLRFTTLAQVLRARGYATAAFASRIALVDRENLGRGFEVADFVAGEPGNLRGMRAEAERMQRRA